MSRKWEVDPETRTKLLQISKTNGNDKCCDCGAPAPQWASPKFGTFICLNCAGIHRGLGVHISFVRSVTMDAFKPLEIQRMENGGNDPWKNFFDSHPVTLSEGRTFEDSTIKERYDCEVGEEWKERLTAKIEGTEYDPEQAKANKNKKKTATTPITTANIDQQQQRSSNSSTPLSPTGSGSGGGGGGDNLLRDDPLGFDNRTKKERNEAYFAKLGSQNATRPSDLPPSQGGKYSGFGGGLPPPSSPSSSSSKGGFGASGVAVPGFDDFQKDPMGTLTKGFGWFTSTVGKSAKSMNDSYIQPTAKSLAESDLAAQARVRAAYVGENLQAGARGAADSFNRFVEGPPNDGDPAATSGAAAGGAGGGGRRTVEPEHKDFWDDFSSIPSQQQEQKRSSSGAIGTAAMKQGPSATAAAASSSSAVSTKDKDW